mmetsp:Transcript_44406/g.100411  ORF Transcript_44406/g.100411 Transcript_44406/m.100411 type:complete len:367 (+) Transcript_44406:386-1486(+)
MKVEKPPRHPSEKVEKEKVEKPSPSDAKPPEAKPLSHDPAKASEGEAYEPFDPSAAKGTPLELVLLNLGYDLAAASQWSALDSGTALCRAEAFRPVGLHPQPPGRVDQDHQGQATKCDRESVLGRISMEKGMAAMAMMPLPVWIAGHGYLGKEPQQGAEEGVEQEHGAAKDDKDAKAGAKHQRSQPAACRSAYAPEETPLPYRNGRGDLVVTVHRSKMAGLVLSQERGGEVSSGSSPFSSRDSSPGPTKASESWTEDESLVPSAEPSIEPRLIGYRPPAFRAEESASLTARQQQQEEEEEEESALDRLKKKGRKRKLVPPLPLLNSLHLQPSPVPGHASAAPSTAALPPDPSQDPSPGPIETPNEG